MFGLLASVGDSTNLQDSGRYVNIGVEAVHTMGKFRFYGQAGYTPGVAGYAGTYASHDAYVAAVLAYYCNPDLAFSVNIGGDSYGNNDSFSETRRATSCATTSSCVRKPRRRADGERRR